MAQEDVVALSIATRPDCLSPEVLRLLMECNRKMPVWVELGLQTIHENTAQYIRRGYALSVFDDAVKRLQEAGISVIVHVIRGTDLEKEYQQGKFQVLELEEYVQLVADCIALLPKDMVIHRMTGDGDKRTLIAPMWSADKKKVLNRLNQVIRERDRRTESGTGSQY